MLRGVRYTFKPVSIGLARVQVSFPAVHNHDVAVSPKKHELLQDLMACCRCAPVVAAEELSLFGGVCETVFTVCDHILQKSFDMTEQLRSWLGLQQSAIFFFKIDGPCIHFHA